MTRAIVTAFHMYTPDWGQEYYQPILDFYLQNMKKYKNEYDQLYLIDSNWNIAESPDYKVIKVDQNSRYYDAYKSVLPQIKEDLVLFMDDDMVVYRPGVIKKTFDILEQQYAIDADDEYYGHDVVSIYDTIGTRFFPELGGKSKFCLYWFATRKELLMKYRDVDWGQAPWGETLSYLTEAMLKDGLKPYEWEEDKSNILFDGTKDGEHSKDLGYYHIRSGSVPALLLAYKKEGKPQYRDYIDHQPKTEYLRQLAWYHYMVDSLYTDVSNPPKVNYSGLLADLDINPFRFGDYFDKFRKYHGL